MKSGLIAALLCAFAAFPLTLTGCTGQRTSADAESAFSKGIAAYKSYGDTVAAVQFRLAAEQGNAKAKAYLGITSSRSKQKDNA